MKLPPRKTKSRVLCLLASGPLAAVLAALIATCSARADVTTDAIGYVTLTIKGQSGSGASALSFLGIGLTRPTVYKGVLESVGAASATTEAGDWSDSQFAPVGGVHYIEITSGAACGHASDITATDAQTKTIGVDPAFSQLLGGGEAFKIRQHWTLASLFGPNNEAGLGAGSNTAADEILVYDPVAGTYTTYFYKTSGLGGTGWRSAASASVDHSGAQLDPTRGILIRRKQPGDLKVKVFGVVKTGSTSFPVYAGLNILPNPFPSDALTLGNSGLFTEDPATGLAGGSNVSADKVLIFNGSSYDTYYFKTSGLGGTGWRSAASVSADASATVLPSGTSILIQRAKDRGPFFWLVQQPF